MPNTVESPKVTEDSARILVELPSAGEVQVVVTADGPAGRATVDVRNVTAGEPYVFVFTGLDVDTRHTVAMSGWAHVASSFRTIKPDLALADRPVFAIAACNRIEYTRLEPVPLGGDVWEGLRDKVAAGAITYMFHIGDEVYSDDWHEALGGRNTFLDAIDLIAAEPDRALWPRLRPQLRDMYADLFRATWSHPPTAAVLAAVPNVMVADDHEYADDMGDSDLHRDPMSKEYFLFHSVRKVVLLYERQLWQDVPQVHEVDEPPLLPQ
eukprot:gene2331-3164_t